MKYSVSPFLPRGDIDRFLATILSARNKIRIMRAPHVKRVWGCIDTGYEWPDTPESGRSAAGVSNVTAANTLVNGFLELGRTEFGTVEVRGPVGGFSIGRSDGHREGHGGNKALRNVELAWVRLVAVGPSFPTIALIPQA